MKYVKQVCNEDKTIMWAIIAGINYITYIANNTVNLFFSILTGITETTGIFAPVIIAAIFVIIGILREN